MCVGLWFEFIPKTVKERPCLKDEVRQAAMFRRSASRFTAEHAQPSNRATKYDKMPPIRDVWVTYQKTRSEDIRNFLMEKFLHLVRYNAERIYGASLTRDLQDLIKRRAVRVDGRD